MARRIPTKINSGDATVKNATRWPKRDARAHAAPKEPGRKRRSFCRTALRAREKPRPDASGFSTQIGQPSRPFDEYHGAVGFKYPLGVHVAEKLDQLGHRPRPARLVARAKP